ncbi:MULTISPECIES: DUF350 domain-containing protein [unclassified Solwaraspora]|uniref:DUF350 domain-containing protein n=1 Tax=unclassified Solwaraspora TaxID=2627926 RepID=UPI00259B0B1C|nr:DUF350 domain-containing protein [Solwaraspora sp. WMMA2056]WJK38544.1 DUF350 domain-containing protein [Solwaraspora sp. WMMA2056]
MFRTLVVDLLLTLAYGGVGLALMALGYLLVDVVTPGKLHQLIWVERNRNATILLASNLVAVGIIVVAAITAGENSFVTGLVGTTAYGLLGLAVMAVSFVLLDAVTPGRLGDILVDREPHPAVWVSAVVHLATGAIVAAAIS